MNSKAIIRIVLLAVIAVAIGGWVVKEFGSSGDVATNSESETAAEAAHPDGVTVVNFHGEKRCRTCIGIGELAKKTIDEEFAAEEKAGKLHWKHINYEESPNTRFVQDYELVSSTVVVSLWKDGKEVEWKRLDGVWDHVGDEPAFRTYIADNVRELLTKQQ